MGSRGKHSSSLNPASFVYRSLSTLAKILMETQMREKMREYAAVYSFFYLVQSLLINWGLISIKILKKSVAFLAYKVGVEPFFLVKRILSARQKVKQYDLFM